MPRTLFPHCQDENAVLESISIFMIGPFHSPQLSFTSQRRGFCGSRIRLE